MYDCIIYFSLILFNTQVFLSKENVLTVSELQSRSIYHRNNMTFIWCLLGFTLFYKQLNMNKLNFMHLSLPLLSVCPLNTILQNELCIIKVVSSKITNLLHYIIVFNYITLYPFYMFIMYGRTLYSIILSCSFILYFLIFFEYKYIMYIESILITIITLIFNNE